jgi:hypothetical protein
VYHCWRMQKHYRLLIKNIFYSNHFQKWYKNVINNAIFCRHFTTTRPLPLRTDIASSQTCPFDSVNSPRSILLAIYLLTNISLWKKSITVQKSLMNVIKNIYIFKTELTTAIEIILIPVNFQTHYYSYPIFENGLNKIYFKLITYNVFACANSDTHSSFTLYHDSWTKIQY